MNILILGSGGREHALAHAVSKSKQCDNLVVIPGNPGIKNIAKCVDIDPFNNDKIREFCGKQKINLIIPGSEALLENGIADAFFDTDIKVFGPSKKATMIESSKQYAKDLMKRYHIPTANYEVFDNYLKAVEYVKTVGVPIVIKYDGLAAGKGVVVTHNFDEAIFTLDIMLNQKKYGNNPVVIEEYLEGPEFSLMTFVHENRVIPMPIAQDHKRLLENDQGPNTGGMGIYSSVPIIPQESIDFALEHIMQKTVDAMANEGTPFTGFLYGGLMNTKDGPKVIEFNARFGDPETEVILPKLKTDFLDIIDSLYNGSDIKVEWDNTYYLGVVLASKGYPNSYQKGYQINGIPNVGDMIYHMGTKEENGKILTNGGRVLLVLGKGDTLQNAYKDAYMHVDRIECDNLIYRKDIGYKALKGK
jgi:phosphoribosylamine--glycine ligase